MYCHAFKRGTRVKCARKTWHESGLCGVHRQARKKRPITKLAIGVRLPRYMSPFERWCRIEDPRLTWQYGYEVSNFGRVKKNGWDKFYTILRLFDYKRGLTVNLEKIPFRVRNLVKRYHTDIDEDEEVIFINGNEHDCSIWNLKRVRPDRRLTQEQAEQVRLMMFTGVNVIETARKFEVDPKIIRDIRDNKIYKEVKVYKDETWKLG